MIRKISVLVLSLLILSALASARDRDDANNSPVVIAQISDIHMGLSGYPQAADNLRRVVDMVNQRRPDAVIVTGDIGERPDAREEAKRILSGLKAHVYYIPGNHDDKASDVSAYKSDFGDNYYVLHVRYVTIFALDSQLLGNYDNFDARSVVPLSEDGKERSAAMLDWFSHAIDREKTELASARKPQGGGPEPVVLAMQHVPIDRADGFPRDPKPYWTVQEPYRSRELDLLHRLGVKDMFVGHWHVGKVFKADGITFHVAPSTTRPLFGGQIGFAMHTIEPNGDVKTEFVNLQ